MDPLPSPSRIAAALITAGLLGRGQRLHVDGGWRRGHGEMAEGMNNSLAERQCQHKEQVERHGQAAIGQYQQGVGTLRALIVRLCAQSSVRAKPVALQNKNNKNAASKTIIL